MLSLAWRGTRTAGGSKCRWLERSLALSQVWWTDGGRRKAYGCTNPTSFSTVVHFCRMKRLSPTRILCASRRALSLCVFNPEQNSILNFLSASSTILSSPSPFPASSAELYRTVSATLHTAVSSHSITIGLASAATTSGFLLALIERARSYMPASLLCQNARPIRY